MNFIFEPSPGLPLVSGMVVFRVGSTSDPEGHEGLARATMRLLRRGTKKLSAAQIDDLVDSMGAELSTDASYSWLSVSFEVLARNVDRCCGLIASILGEPSFDAEEFAKLLRATQAEIIESRDNDRTLASRAMRRAVFGNHPYARRVSGTVDSIAKLSLDDLKAFHKAHVCRENAMVVITGDLSEKQARTFADRLLEKLPQGRATKDTVEEPTQKKGRRLIFVDKPDRSQSQLYIGTLGTHAHDGDHTALQVATTAFGGTFTSPLMREVRGERGFSYGASARLGIERRRDLFAVWTAPADKQVAECLALELELLEHWAKKGPLAADVAFAKTYMCRSRVFDIDTASKRAHLRLDEMLYSLPRNYHHSFTDRVQAVTAKQASEAVKQRIHLDHLVITLVGTHSAIGAEVEKAIPGLTSSEVVPFDFE